MPDRQKNPSGCVSLYYDTERNWVGSPFSCVPKWLAVGVHLPPWRLILKSSPGPQVLWDPVASVGASVGGGVSDGMELINKLIPSTNVPNLLTQLTGAGWS